MLTRHGMAKEPDHQSQRRDIHLIYHVVINPYVSPGNVTIVPRLLYSCGFATESIAHAIGD